MSGRWIPVRWNRRWSPPLPGLPGGEALQGQGCGGCANQLNACIEAHDHHLNRWNAERLLLMQQVDPRHCIIFDSKYPELQRQVC